MDLIQAALLTFIINLPFGYWRANVPRKSKQWFAAIHIPVPFIVAIRFLGGLGWALETFPVLVLAFFLGQFTGGRVKRLVHGRVSEPSSCLFLDLYNLAK